MRSPKDQAREIIDRLPDTATLNDIMYELYVRQKIERGKQASEEGRDAPVYAESYVQRIVDAVSRLEDLPHSGRKVPESSQDDIREIIFGIVHGSRDLRQVRNQPW